MAGGRKKQIEAQPPEPGDEEVEVKPEDSVTEVEEIEPEAEAAPRSRRTAKTRAPARDDTVPVPRQRTPRREASRRRDPRQLSLLSRLSQERMSRTVTRTGGSVLISLLAIGGLVVLFHLFAGSRFFALKGVTVVWPAEESGVAPLLSASEVERIVRENAPRGVLNADLEKIREKLKENPLIREVEVARLLPDRLRVTIVERQPVALARRKDTSVACVDDDGVMFGLASYWRRGATPPLINGLDEGGGEEAQRINRQWLALYKKLMAELDQTEPPLSSQVDEIFFDKNDGVRLLLTEDRGGVMVGHEDFRAKLNVALDILAAVNSKDLDKLNLLRIGDAERLLNGKINYLNVNDPQRPIVGLDE